MSTGRERWGDRLWGVGGRYCLTQGLKPRLVEAESSGLHAKTRGSALPESFVQGDALGLMLTEVHLGHTVVNHLITQLPWRSWGRKIRHPGGYWGSPRPQGQTCPTLGHRSWTPGSLHSSLGTSFFFFTRLLAQFPWSDSEKVPGVSGHSALSG